MFLPIWRWHCGLIGITQFPWRNSSGPRHWQPGSGPGSSISSLCLVSVLVTEVHVWHRWPVCRCVDHNWRHADGRDAVCRRGGARVHAAERQLRATAGRRRRRRDDYMLQSGNYEQQLVVVVVVVVTTTCCRAATTSSSWSSSASPCSAASPTARPSRTARLASTTSKRFDSR